MECTPVPGNGCRSKRYKRFPALIFLLLVLAFPAAPQVLPSVEAWVEKADAYKNTDPAKAADIAVQALSCAQKAGHKPSVARVERYLGVVYFMMGAVDKAREHFEHSLAIYQQLRDEKGIAACLNNLGVIQQETGRYDEAIASFEKSVQIKLSLGDTAGACSGMINMGTISLYRGEHRKAIGLFNRVLRFAQSVNDTSGIIDSRINLASVCNDRQMSDSALYHLSEARLLAEYRGDNYSLGYCLNDMGVAYSHAGDHRRAVDHFNKALVIRDDLGDLAGMATTLDNLGKMYVLERNYDKSLGFHYQSMKLSQQLNDSRSMAISQNSVAELLIRQGDYKGAEAYLRKAIATAHTLKLDSYLPVMVANLLKVFGARQQFDSIDHYFLHKDHLTDKVNSSGGMASGSSVKPLKKEPKGDMMALFFVTVVILLALLSAVFTFYFRKMS